jgi:hypothetical protein
VLPGQPENLLPGKYTIVINSCQFGESAKVQFEVKVPPR